MQINWAIFNSTFKCLITKRLCRNISLWTIKGFMAPGAPYFAQTARGSEGKTQFLGESH